MYVNDDMRCAWDAGVPVFLVCAIVGLAVVNLLVQILKRLLYVIYYSDLYRKYTGRDSQKSAVYRK